MSSDWAAAGTRWYDDRGVAHVQQGGRKVRVSPGRLKTTKHPDAAKDAATPK